MLRFLLVPLLVIQIFMMFGFAADDSNFSPGWNPNGSTATGSNDFGPGWDPDG